MSKGKKIKMRGHTASYKYPDGKFGCDLVELAETYVQVGKIPERLCFGKACEISLLAQAFLTLNAKYEAEFKGRTK